MKPVAVIDNGGANLASLDFALARIGVRMERVSKPDELQKAERAILPGVGVASDAMQRLEKNGLVEALRDFQRPLLGVCLGLQLLFESSSEGDARCLGLLQGNVEEFNKSVSKINLPVPHVGWNQLTDVASHPVLEGIGSDDWFYFVHSYCAPLTAETLASCEYGEKFAAVAGKANIIAAQFHPERSSSAGARLLENFMRWSP